MYYPLSRAAVLALLLALMACGPDQHASFDAPETATEPVEMSVTHPRVRQIVQPIYGSGTITAVQSSNISPEISGIVEEIYVHVGARVEVGDPLFQIKRDNFEFALAEAESAAELASAVVEQAERAANRASTLNIRGVTSEARLEEAQSALRVERARRDAAIVALERARNNLEATTVLAPYRGVITARYIDEGAFMTPQGNSQASAVVQLQEIQRVHAIVEVPEIHLVNLRIGMQTRVYVDGVDQAFNSQVDVLNDRINPQTRTIELRLGISNEEYSLRPGLFARAEIFPEARHAVLLERRAISGPTNAPYVFVLSNGRANRHEVQIREFDADYVEILGGFGPEEEILLGPNLPRLRQGVNVTVME